jgi:iron complex outermembrane recepter protein
VSGFPVNGTANGPDSRSRGWELAARYKVTPALEVKYSTTTTEAKWAGTKTHCLYVAQTSCRTWAEGGLLGGAPKWKHNLGLRFQHTFDNDLNVWASLSARYQSAVQVDRSDRPEDNAGFDKYASYTRYAFSTGASMGAWDAQLWVSNATNLRLVSSVQAAGIMGPREISPQPRTVGVNFSYKFF